MALHAAVGQATDLDGREAASQAAQLALTQMDAARPVAAIVFASHEYEVQAVQSGLAARLGDTPVFGFSTAGELSSGGRGRRSVVVALVAGDGLAGRVGWAQGNAENGGRGIEELSAALGLGANSHGALLLAGPGLTLNGDALGAALPPGDYALAGALAGGDVRRGHTFQIAGGQAGGNGLAGLYLGGNVTAGVASGHGWRSVGAYFKITGTRGAWVRMLDGKPASETYASLFGHSARDWAFPPLNEMVRLYPLGLEADGVEGLNVRTPLQVEPDGSLRMNALVAESTMAHLLVGSTEACLTAARDAAGRALKALGGAKPRLAIVLADVGWEMLFRGQPGAEVGALRDVLGPDVPLAGGYTLGQFARPGGDGLPQFLNQQMVVLVLGEKGEV
ncbi:MAG: hypothetical protein EPO32_01965 [Anaerolineae bacterium]|nr:MAG: hypothetical protein EPO32_01965 [Anaerolineae bacterium]